MKTSIKKLRSMFRDKKEYSQLEKDLLKTPDIQQLTVDFKKAKEKKRNALGSLKVARDFQNEDDIYDAQNACYQSDFKLLCQAYNLLKVYDAMFEDAKPNSSLSVVIQIKRLEMLREYNKLYDAMDMFYSDSRFVVLSPLCGNAYNDKINTYNQVTQDMLDTFKLDPKPVSGISKFLPFFKSPAYDIHKVQVEVDLSVSSSSNSSSRSVLV